MPTRTFKTGGKIIDASKNKKEGRHVSCYTIKVVTNKNKIARQKVINAWAKVGHVAAQAGIAIEAFAKGLRDAARAGTELNKICRHIEKKKSAKKEDS